MPKAKFNLNGKPVEVPYEPGMHLLEVLREQCGIVSPKNGCAPEGTCGCCAVLIDGRPVLSCLRKPEQIDGRDVVTLEGIPEDMRSVLGEAFVLEGGVQCGRQCRNQFLDYGKADCTNNGCVRETNAVWLGDGGLFGRRRKAGKAPERPPRRRGRGCRSGR